MLALAHVAEIVGIFVGTALAFALGLLCVLYLGTRQVGRPELRRAAHRPIRHRRD
jgi:hypothetical protein